MHLTFEKSIKKRCSQFLSGSWSGTKEEDITVEYLEGGLTNYLYVCTLKKNIEIEQGESRSVIFRKYGEIHTDEDKHKEAVLFAILSERKIGPRLLASFLEGRIEEYIPTRSLKTEDIRQPLVSWKVAEKSAEYHMLDMPTKKNEPFVKDSLESWIAKSRLEPWPHMIVTQYNISREFEWLSEILLSLDSPTVFSHNDLQEGNIMFETDSTTEAPKIRFIDFEYSCYNHRGFDLGNHFCEWVFCNHSENDFGFSYNYKDYPSDHHLMKFSQIYLDSVMKIAEPSISKKRLKLMLKSPSELVKEINLYSLESHLFWGVWGLIQSTVSEIPFNFREYSLARLEAYYYFKKIFVSRYNLKSL